MKRIFFRFCVVALILLVVLVISFIVWRAILIKEAESVADLRIAIAAIAADRFRLAHEQLPKNLNVLVPQFLSAVPIDPFDGRQLRYHRLTKGYVIYSIGTDRRDDGGHEQPANWKSGDKTNYDITFTVER